MGKKPMPTIRQAPQIPEATPEKMQAFVSGVLPSSTVEKDPVEEDDAPVASEEPDDPPASRSTTSKSKRSRKEPEQLRRIAVYLAPKVARDLRVRCAKEDIRMSTWVARLVHEHLYAERRSS